MASANLPAQGLREVLASRTRYPCYRGGEKTLAWYKISSNWLHKGDVVRVAVGPALDHASLEEVRRHCNRCKAMTRQFRAAEVSLRGTLLREPLQLLLRVLQLYKTRHEVLES